MFAVLACATLVLIAVEDLARFRIRNSRVAIVCLLFLAQATLIGPVAWAQLAGHLLLAVALLIPMAGAFAARLVGAGDAKLMAAAGLWVGPEGAILFALALLVLAVASCAGARFRLIPTKSSDARRKIPFGPSIAGACALVVTVRYLL